MTTTTMKKPKDPLVVKLKNLIDIGDAALAIFKARDRFGKPIVDPASITNPDMAKGLVEYFNVIQGNVKQHCCPFHPTQDANSTPSKIKKVAGTRLAQRFCCQTPICRLYNISLDIFDLYGVLVKNIHPDNLSTQTKKYFREAKEFYAKQVGLEHELPNFDLSSMEPDELSLYRKNKAVKIALQFMTDCFMGRHPRKDIQKQAAEARRYFLEGRAFLYPFWDPSKGEEQREEVTQKALEFAQKRGVFFAPGYSNSSFCYEYLRRSKWNFTDEELYAASLLGFKYVNGMETNQYCDYLINRIGLPMDPDFITGILGLYGRDQKAESNMRHKKPREGRSVYNLEAALQHEIVFAVEGEWDALTLESLVSMFIKAFIPQDQHELLLDMGAFPLGGSHTFQDDFINYIINFRKEHGNKYIKELVLVGDADSAGQAINFKYGKAFAAAGIHVSVMILSDDEDKKFDANALLQKYKGLARARFRKLFDQRISFEAFAVNYVLDKYDLSSEMGQRMAFRETTEFVRHLAPHEQLLVGKKVCNLIAEKDTTFFFDAEDRSTFLKCLLATWKLIEEEIVEQGFAESCQYNFLILTKNASVYDALRERYDCPNVVWVNNRSQFLKLWKQAQLSNPTTPRTAVLDLTFSEREWEQIQEIAALHQLAADLPTLQTSVQPLNSFFRESPIFGNGDAQATA